MPDVSELETTATASPQSSSSMLAAMSRPSENQYPALSSGLQSPRPTTHSPLTSSINIYSPLVSRRPSSSLYVRSVSSRRTSMLSPTDPSLPQRLPRQPSQRDIAAFAELFQELEIEHEAQVNRLLKIIRLHQLQCPQPYSVTDNSSTAATIDLNPATAGRARSPACTSSLSRRGSGRLSREHSSSRRSHSVASATPFPGGNPVLDNSSDSSSGAPWLGPAQPDMAYCVTEAREIKRQADMLGLRMKELERQVMELSLKSATAGSDVGSPFS